MTRRGSSATRALLAAVATAAISTTGANAATIGLDFGGNSGGGNQTQMGPTESAGVLPSTNWNSFTTNLQATPVALNDSTGAATTATAAWSSNNLWAISTADTPGDLRMMRGYLDANGNGQAGDTTTVTVANLPAAIAGAPYSVIVYYDGDNGPANRVGKYSIAGATTGNATLYALDAAGNTFSGVYTPAFTPVDPLAGGGAMTNNATAPLTVPAGDFLFFTGLTGSGFTLSAQSYVTTDGTSRAAINGIQIISGNVPEPTALSLLGLSVTAIVGRRRRR